MAHEVKLLILHDDDRWAQAHNARGLQRFAPPWCHVTVAKLGTVLPVNFDTVYCLNLPSSSAGQVSCVASHAWMYPEPILDDWSTRGVNPCRNSITGARHVSVLSRVVCRNEALGAWARQHNQNVGVFPAGVDTSIFYPKSRTPRKKLRVGWCGQVHTDDQHGQVKGYKEIYLPLVERLGNGYEFEANANTAVNAKSPEEMAEWLNSLDVFLSTSCNDGTPNPPFQAAACGCAVVSTDVGQVHDWQALRWASMIVPTYRNEDESRVTAEKIRVALWMLESESQRRRIQERLLASVESTYAYKVLAPKTLAFICGRDE